jgi:hypothetical protein
MVDCKCTAHMLGLNTIETNKCEEIMQAVSQLWPRDAWTSTFDLGKKWGLHQMAVSEPATQRDESSRVQEIPVCFGTSLA